jgi:hypothetical protein
MIEERRQSKILCFSEEITGAKATTPKTVLGSSPDKDGSSSSETKHERRMVQRKKIVCFGVEITGTRVKNHKTVLGWSLGEDWFGDNNLFHDIQLCVSNDQAYDNVLSKKG